MPDFRGNQFVSNLPVQNVGNDKDFIRVPPTENSKPLSAPAFGVFPKDNHGAHHDHGQDDKGDQRQ